MLGIKCKCHGSSEMTIKTDDPCHSRYGTLKNPHCSLAISAEHRSNLQPFTGNGDVSKWVKNSWVGRTNNIFWSCVVRMANITWLIVLYLCLIGNIPVTYRRQHIIGMVPKSMLNVCCNFYCMCILLNRKATFNHFETAFKHLFIISASTVKYIWQIDKTVWKDAFF